MSYMDFYKSNKRIPEHDLRKHIRVTKIGDPDKIDTDAQNRITARQCSKMGDGPLFVCPVCGTVDTFKTSTSAKAKRVLRTVNVFRSAKFECCNCHSMFKTGPVLIDRGYAFKEPMKDVSVYSVLSFGYFLNNLSELKCCNSTPIREHVEIDIALGVVLGFISSVIFLYLINGNGCWVIGALLAFMVGGGMVANMNFFRSKQYYRPDKKDGGARK